MILTTVITLKTCGEYGGNLQEKEENTICDFGDQRML
jgi:hypothetical protein